MTDTIFFSWQADTDPKTGRNLIDRVLNRAVGSIGSDATVDEAVRDLAVDSDTKDAPGFPPIVDTIFHKIDAAAVFVPDLTFVGKRLDGRPTPNPNVLIEYGWALKTLTYNRIVPVMNTHYGEPKAENMPFDMGHLRRPIVYNCAPDADEATVKAVKAELTKTIERAIRAVLTSDEYLAGLVQAPAPQEFVGRTFEGTPGRFKGMGIPIGVTAERLPGQTAVEVRLAKNPVVWFRVMPVLDPGREWLVTELQKHATSLQPLLAGWSGYNYVRTHEGFGVYAAMGSDDTPAVVFTFTNGEVWSADAYILAAMASEGRNAVPSIEEYFRASLTAYADFLVKLGIPPPFRWIAGMENLRNRGIVVPARPGHTSIFQGPRGSCQLDVISASGTYTPGDPPGQSLKPFFTKLFDSCGIERPSHLDE